MPKSSKPRKKHTPKPVLTPLLRFNRGGVVSLSLRHLQMIDAIKSGEADGNTLLDFTHAVHAWWTVSKPEDKPLFDRAFDMCLALIDRIKTKGKVLFKGSEIQTANELIEWINDKTETINPEKIMLAVQQTKHKFSKAIAEVM